MRKKKKYILIRKIASFFFVLVIGVVFTLQGFCASTINIDLTKYSCSKFTVLGGANSYTVTSVPSITSNRYYQGVWPSGNTFTTVLYTLSSANSVLSAKSNYRYDVCFDLVFTDSTSISDLNSVIVYLGDNDPYVLSYTTSGSTRIYSFSSNYLGQNMSSILSSINLGIYFNAGVTYTNFAIQNLRVVEHTPNEDVISYFDQPVTPPANQGGTDTTISDYHQKEDQLTSNAAGVVSDLPGMISALDMSDFAGGFNLFNDLFTDFWSRSGKLKMIALFAIVSGSVMVILGLGVRGSRRLDPDKPPKEVIHKHYLAGKSKDNSSNKGSD